MSFTHIMFKFAHNESKRSIYRYLSKYFVSGIFNKSNKSVALLKIHSLKIVSTDLYAYDSILYVKSQN